MGCSACKAFHRAAFSYMQWPDYAFKYKSDDQFKECADNTHQIFLGQKAYTGYKQSVDRNLGGRLLIRRRLLGYTREAFAAKFGATPEQAGFKVRLLPDVDGSSWQGVVVADRKQDVREMILESSTGYDFNEHLLMPNENMHVDQGEGTYSASRLSDKKFHELQTMATKASSIEDYTRWVVVLVLGGCWVGGSSCSRGCAQRVCGTHCGWARRSP